MAGTGVVWPVDAVSGAPSYTGRMLRNTQAPFLAGATAARPLGAISGVRPGTPNVVSATSTLYTVTPFAGIIDLEAAAISGPYAFAFNANVTGAVTAASGSIARKDIVYVQINDNAEGDGTAGTPNIKIDYLAGTVASTAPAAPARSFVIAEINVPVSGGGSPTVTWVAPYSVAAGAIQPIPSSSAYPASPSAGVAVWDQTTKALAIHDGTQWTGGAWTNGTLAAGWSSGGSAGGGTFWAPFRYRLNALGEVEIQGQITPPAAVAPSAVFFTLPTGFRPAGQLEFPCSINTNAGRTLAGCQITAAGQMSFSAGSIQNVNLGQIVFATT